jgi:hypothetical protein
VTDGNVGAILKHNLRFLDSCNARPLRILAEYLGGIRPLADDALNRQFAGLGVEL